MIRQEIKILFVDDHYDEFVIFKEILAETETISPEIDWAKNYDTASEKILNENYDIYIIDYLLGIESGIDLLIQNKTKLKNKPVIIITGQDNREVDLLAMEAGATDYIPKEQMTPVTLERSIRYAINNKRLDKELREQTEMKSLVLNLAYAGICVIDNIEETIIEANDYFLYMFGFKREEVFGQKLNNIVKFFMYDDILYKTDKIKKEHICPKDPTKCPCLGNREIEVNIVTNKEISIDCLMSCKSIEIKNGKTKIYRVLTLVDITKQKEYQKKMLDSQEELRSIIKKYGIKYKNDSVLMSLINHEVNRLSKMKDFSNWISSLKIY